MSEPIKRSTTEKIIIGLAFFLIVILLVAIAIPNFFKTRVTSCANSCLNNLRQIDAAANQLALEHSLTNGAPINFPDDLTPYIKLNAGEKISGCSLGGVYSIKKVGDTVTCSLGSTVTPSHVVP